MKLLLFKVIVLLIVIISACSKYRFIDVQVLKPANIILPYKVNNLYIIDKWKLYVDTNIMIDGSGYKKMMKQFNIELAANLKQSPLFATANIVEATSDSIISTYKKLSLDEKKHSYIISIKSIIIKDTFSNELLSNENFECTDCNYSLRKNKILYTFQIGLKNFIYNNSIDNYIITDSVAWEEVNKTLDTIPIAKKYEIPAYEEIGNILAEKYASHITPTWETIERGFYFSPNYKMRKAYRLFVKNELEKAITIWTDVYSSGTNLIAAKAAYNIGLSYEMLDEIDSTKTWLSNSYQKHPAQFTMNYLMNVQNRIKERDSLDVQVNSPK